MSSTDKKFAFDIGWVFISAVIALGLGFILRMFIGRISTGDLGIYSLIMLLLSLSRLIGGFGVKSSIVKFGAEEDSKRLFNHTLVLTIILGALASLALFILSPFIETFFDMELAHYVLLLVIALPFVFIYDSLLGILNGTRRMNMYAFGIILQNLIFVSFAIFAIINGGGLDQIIMALVLSFIASTCLLGAYHAMNWGFSISRESMVADWKRLLSFGSKIFVSNVVNLFNYQIDLILIGFFMADSDVGIYSVAYVLVRFFWVVPQSIQTITYPATSELWSKGKLRKVHGMCSKSLRLSAVILVLGGMFAYLFGQDFIVLLFGLDYQDSYWPLLILLPGTIAIGIAKSIGSSLAGIGKPEISMNISLVTATINTILNLILIPERGIEGAALATSFTLMLFSVLIIYYSAKHLRFRVPVGYFSKVGGITMGVIILHMLAIDLADDMLLRLGIMGLFMILVMTFMISRKDVQDIRSMLFTGGTS